MDDELSEYLGEPLDSHPWKWSYLGFSALCFTRDVVSCLADRMSYVIDHVGSHINYQVDQHVFHAEAALEIETLTEQPKE